MEKYVIYRDDTSTSKEYVEYIYRNSISKDKDMGDAIEFYDKETAVIVCNYLNKRESGKNYKVMCIKTTIEEDVQ